MHMSLMSGACGMDEGGDHDDKGSEGGDHDDKGSQGGDQGDDMTRRLSKRRRLEAGAEQPADGDFGTTSIGEGGDDGMKVFTDMCHVYGAKMEGKPMPAGYEMGACGKAIYDFMDSCKEGDKLPMDEGEMVDYTDVVKQMFEELDCSAKVFIKNDPELFKMYPPRFCK